jgi:hypothetical protein
VNGGISPKKAPHSVSLQDARSGEKPSGGVPDPPEDEELWAEPEPEPESEYVDEPSDDVSDTADDPESEDSSDSGGTTNSSA